MKARVTAKDELRLSDLTREYTFEIIDDENNDKVLVTNQVVRDTPTNIRATLASKVEEYAQALAEEQDVEVGEEV